MCDWNFAPFKLDGKLILPEMDGMEIRPGVFLIGEPSPRPDIGKTALVCLADYHGMLALVELSINFKGKGGQ
jgi:hypothetical protein